MGCTLLRAEPGVAGRSAALAVVRLTLQCPSSQKSLGQDMWPVLCALPSSQHIDTALQVQAPDFTACKVHTHSPHHWWATGKPCTS